MSWPHLSDDEAAEVIADLVVVLFSAAAAGDALRRLSQTEERYKENLLLHVSSSISTAYEFIAAAQERLKSGSDRTQS